MINAIKSIPNYESLTSQQIADALRATGLTQRPIDLGELLFLLNRRGMLVRLIRPADSGEKWAGSLVNLINHCNDNAHPLAMAVNQFFSHITNDRNIRFDTTDPQYAGLFLVIVSTFADEPNMPTTADFAAVADLGGGWLFASVTAEQVEAEIQAELVREQARQRVAAIQERRRKWDAVSALIRSEIESDQVSTLDEIKASLSTKWSN